MSFSFFVASGGSLISLGRSQRHILDIRKRAEFADPLLALTALRRPTVANENRRPRPRSEPVTAGPAAEDRGDAVLAAEVGQARRLPLLLTRMDLLTTADHGPLDCVWRIPGVHKGRRAWPDALGII